ncbi:MAG: cellulase family glycosylhydrolase [Candidatus Nanohaloarchaea archaeon]|nr:cellulase family glycosylhydrolase [Candidatus Nanohaloarchaea archaeon]
MNNPMSRREILKTGIIGVAGGLAGCTGSSPESGDDTSTPTPNSDTSTGPGETETATEPADLPAKFVKRDGTRFVVDGDRYVFAGVANCCLAEGYTSQARVQSVLDGASELGADVLRFKIGCAGAGSDCGGTVDGCTVCFQPEPGKFNETAFKHLDYIVAEAGKRGIRVILPLVDNWGKNGMDQYVAWSDTASNHDDFYTDQRVQELYRGYVKELLTRTNTITGRKYREDPTVLMWELANEPRFDQDYQGFLSWVEDSAEYIHNLDGNHLVSTGSDVYEEDVYVEVHNTDGIDACSIHLWPQNWDREENAGKFGTQYIKNRVERGKEDVGKPVYLGEYGWRVNLQAKDAESQLQRRAEMFGIWHDAALKADIDGAIAWELLSDSRLRYHQEEAGQGETVGFAYPEHSATIEELQSFMKQIQKTSG